MPGPSDVPSNDVPNDDGPSDDVPSYDELSDDEPGGDEPGGDAVRLGQEYGLGALRSELSARRRAGSVAVGIVLIAGPLIVAASWSPVLFFLGGAVTRVTSAVIVAGLVAAGIAVIRRAPAPRVDRAFWYSGGLIQLAAGEPEPRVIRWVQLASVSVRVGSSDDKDSYVSACTVCDEAGTCITLDHGYGEQIPPDLAGRATRVLTPRLVPAFIRDFDAGQPISFGGLSVDREGVTSATATQAVSPRLTPWREIRRIDVEGPGTAVRLVTGRISGPRVSLDNVENGLLAQHVIEHAAVQAGIEVRHIDEKALPARPRSRPLSCRAPPSPKTGPDHALSLVSPPPWA